MTRDRDGLLIWLAFSEAARSHPGSIALINGPASISYDQLHVRALGCAARLRASLPGGGSDPPGWDDAGGGPLIALVGLDPAATLAWMFGALSAGASVVPVAASEPDRGAQLRLLRPDVTIGRVGDRHTAERAEIARRSVVAGSRLPPGLVVCTSGTMGEPKAVVHSHVTMGHAVRRLQLFRLEAAGTPERVPADTGALACDLLGAAAAPALGLRYATTMPLSTIAGLTAAFQALLAGDCLVVPGPSEPSALLAALRASGATNVSLTPFLAQLVLRAARREPPPLPERLLFVGIGGGPVGPTLPAALEAVLGCPVAVGYGTTETGGALAMGRVTDPAALRHHTVGRPLPGVELAIDADTEELSVTCASTALGYLSRTGTLDPVERASFPTGDRARVRPDGAVELGGRIDALILRGGRNIDPVRIEQALEDHPAVRRAGAFGRANPTIAGEDDIWTVVELDHDVGEPELRAHCNRTLGASLTPRRILAVDELPVTADGAVRRHELTRLTSPTGATS